METEGRFLKDKQYLADTLNALDEAAAGSAASHAREAERFAYRVMTVRCEIQDTGGYWQPSLVVTRNISRDGIGMLTGRFIYPGRPCRVYLTTLQNATRPVTGKVVRCRYLVGTGSLHEVGVRFDRSIDPAMFVRGAISANLLIVDDDRDMHRIVTHMLRSSGVSVEAAETCEDAVRIVGERDFDVILMNVNMPAADPFETARQIRANGYLRPIVALTETGDAQMRERCAQAGFSECVAKPLDRDSLEAVVATLRSEPLFSTYASEHDFVELIDRFVESLPERVRELESSFLAQDHEALTRVTSGLRGKAGSVGFDVISQSAGELLTAIQQPDQVADLRRQLTNLTRLCLAARPATVQTRPAAGSK